MHLPWPLSPPRLSPLALLGVLASSGCDFDGTWDTTPDTAADTADDTATDTAEPVDLDGDGYPAGADCDDADPTVVPEQEIYGDAVDQDCDGLTEGLDAILPSLDGEEELGTALEIVDATGDGVLDLWFSISGYGTDQGVYLLEGPLSDDLVVPSEPTWDPWGRSSWPGADLDATGDLDGDGVDDLVISSPFADDYRGAIMVIYGSGDEGGELGEVEDRFLGTSVRYYIGDAVASGGDLDGDGIDDLLVGAMAAEDTLIGEGGLYVLSGPIEGELEEGDEVAAVFGGDEYQDFGLAVAHMGDADGDGLGDLLVGGPSEGSSASHDLAAIGLGPLSGTMTADDLDFALTAENSTDAGDTVAAADVNGDGYVDAIVGAPAHSDSRSSSLGTLYVVHGPPASGALSDAELVAVATSDHFYLGERLAVADVDGDGAVDFLVGSPYANDFSHDLDGVVFLLYGPETGTLELGSGSAGVEFGGQANQHLGGALAIGDLNDDGASDLVFGMPDSTEDGPGRGGIGFSWGNVW